MGRLCARVSARFQKYPLHTYVHCRRVYRKWFQRWYVRPCTTLGWQYVTAGRARKIPLTLSDVLARFLHRAHFILWTRSKKVEGPSGWQSIRIPSGETKRVWAGFKDKRRKRLPNWIRDRASAKRYPTSLYTLFPFVCQRKWSNNHEYIALNHNRLITTALLLPTFFSRRFIETLIQLILPSSSPEARLSGHQQCFFAARNTRRFRAFSVDYRGHWPAPQGSIPLTRAVLRTLVFPGQKSQQAVPSGAGARI